MRMAAKIKVCACLCQLGQLRRLVVNHKNWKRLVQSGKQFGRRVACLLRFADPVGIFSARQIKGIIDTDHIILQQMNLRAVQKLTEPSVGDALLLRLKRKARENLLIEIVVAVAGVRAVPAL